MTSMEQHSSQTKIYLAVFAALGLLTAATVGASYLHLARPGAIALALGIAAVKVTLIGAFFMHLKFEKKLIHGFMFTALGFVLILLFLVLPDIGIH